jgi:hypothetical protein
MAPPADLDAPMYRYGRHLREPRISLHLGGQCCCVSPLIRVPSVSMVHVRDRWGLFTPPVTCTLTQSTSTYAERPRTGVESKLRARARRMECFVHGYRKCYMEEGPSTLVRPRRIGSTPGAEIWKRPKAKEFVSPNLCPKSKQGFFKSTSPRGWPFQQVVRIIKKRQPLPNRPKDSCSCGGLL